MIANLQKLGNNMARKPNIPREVPKGLFVCDECHKRHAEEQIGNHYWCRECLCADAETEAPSLMSSPLGLAEQKREVFDTRRVHTAATKYMKENNIPTKDWRSRWY